MISDTHGLLRPQVKSILMGSQLIIHAGDIGDPSIVDELQDIAPVTAVRGNIDQGSWSFKFPEYDVVSFGENLIYILHDLQELDIDPKAVGFAVVVCGHSHRAKNEVRSGVLYFNPGSAGPRRFSLPITVGKLFVNGEKVHGKIFEINP
ncbi:metallophosphoesterase family protein [Pseudomonadota bacterium]